VNTRERIIDAAVILFNDRGTKRVTTNHIAKAAGISPSLPAFGGSTLPGPRKPWPKHSK
jgi:hypothetical protein